MCRPSADKCRSKLGGKDPAYVRSDADLAYTAAELVDGEEDPAVYSGNPLTCFPGAFYNSGQSCCAVEVGALGFWYSQSILTGHNSVFMSTSQSTTHLSVNL